MNTIFCFSGTGNSKTVAQALSKYLPESQLVSLTEESAANNLSGSSVGFIIPIHSLGLPRLVLQAIESMNLDKVDYIYAIASMGGGYGIAFEQIEQLLKKKNKVLASSFAYSFGSNSNLFIKIPGTNPVLSENEQSECHMKMTADMERVASIILSKQSVHVEKISFTFRLLSKMAHKAFLKSLPKFDQQFATRNCVGCGDCVKSCPVQNIALEGKKPVWQGHCEACLRCFNLCSHEAILHGKMDDPKMYQRYTRNLSKLDLKTHSDEV